MTASTGGAQAALAVPVVGVDQLEWDALVERGRANGEVHADQVSHVLRHVELNEERC